MVVAGLVIGILGLIGTVVLGLLSKRVSDAFAKYVTLQDDIDRLKASTADYTTKIEELERLKAGVYHHKHAPKSRAFVPGDKVRLTKVPKNRYWISDHARVGMTGVVVDYGPGTYEFLVYWSDADYEGQPMDNVPNRWQSFYVYTDDLERIA